MRKISYIFLLCIIAGVISSCTSYKKVPYLQTKDKVEEVTLPSFYRENVIRYKPDDALAITVNVVGEPSVAYDYNLPLQPSATTENSSEESVSQGTGRQTFMIDKEGYIDFPVLGRFQAAGYTQAELERYLKESLKKYIKVDPIVTVRIMNFNIKVLGEVSSPGEYAVRRDHINILDALVLAGDMTIYGKRDEVQVIRELPTGEIQKIVVDITDANVVSSPNFYLQQNDMVYVVPNKTRTRSADIGDQTNIILSTVSILVSLASLLYLIFQKNN